MSPGARQYLARKSDHVQPVWCAYTSPIRAPGRLDPILQLKGFAGGVPQNTETAAVKPRVGIESIAKRCLFFVESGAFTQCWLRQGAGRAHEHSRSFQFLRM